jgi:hypothetical protein
MVNVDLTEKEHQHLMVDRQVSAFMEKQRIEADALASTPDAPTETHEHAHEEVKTLDLTPRMDQSLAQKFMSLFKSEMKPGIFVVRKEGSPLRRMFLITSNSYEDREKETITSKALQAYEDSCYPGPDLYHNDNPFLWWHDDDVVMGDIIAVNYSTPYLIEVAQERPDPVSKVLFDYAERNGDAAGVSHRFGYLEKDRLPDGTYERIFKQETTYLPVRDLAANIGTYAGVIGSMASKQSDEWLNKVFEEVGVKDAAEKIHAKTGALEKELAAKGIVHKALPPAPAKKLPVPPKPAAQAVEADAAVEGGTVVAEDEMAADEMEDAMEEEETVSTMDDLKRMAIVMNSMFDMMQTIIQDGAASELDRVGMYKAFDELKELRMSEKAADTVTIEGLEAKVKALQDEQAVLKARQAEMEKTLSLTPRSVTHEKGGTAEGLKVTIDNVEKERKAGKLMNVPGWGDLGPEIDYSAVTGK